MRILSLLLLILYVYPIKADTKDDVFAISFGPNTKSVHINIEYDKSTVISPTWFKKAIYGLSVNGYIKKSSPEYLVRIILVDADDNEHLVMETYDEINSESQFSFSDYCEETAILDSVRPKILKIITKDAILHIDDFNYSETRSDRTHSLSKVRSSQIIQIVDRINSYNIKKKRLWVAGETELSLLEYAKKKMALGVSDDENSGGIEYYVGGIFEFGHTAGPTNPVTASNYADTFDWRNRHGKNWITPSKHQDWSNLCQAFSAVGCLEALGGLYYNQTLNLDLSEQEIIDCADTYPHYAWDGFSLNTVLSYISTGGLCLESDYQMNLCFDPTIELSCKSDSIIPEDRIRPDGWDLVAVNENHVKEALINRGPLISGWGYGSGGHSALLIGYGTLHVGDSVFYNHGSSNTFIATITEEDTTLIGRTYWIFKNSYGPDAPHHDNGCIRVLFPSTESTLNGMVVPAYFTLPLRSLRRTDDDIAIVDEDGDGYYNWGVGPKPVCCPIWIPDLPDGDDSNPSIHHMNAQGNFPVVETFPRGTETLYSNMTISGNESLTSNLEIYHGVTLTITGAAYCLENVKIKSEGGTIIVDGGVIANAELDLDQYSTLTIRNGGSIYMKKGKSLSIPKGCIFQTEEGQVCGPFSKK